MIIVFRVLFTYCTVKDGFIALKVMFIKVILTRETAIY